MNNLKRTIILLAQQEGFDIVGISPPKISNPEIFINWLESGYCADMRYMNRNVDKRLNPSKLMSEVKSIICLGISYYQRIETLYNEDNLQKNAIDEKQSRKGRIAMYAWGQDYHIVLKKKLHQLADKIKKILGRDFRYRAFVDSAPVLETILAEQAGLGWIGKNSCLVNKKLGSFFFLCELFVDFELPTDKPAKNYCGQCRKCIDACPAGAIVAPKIVDARKCISYLTIEHKGKFSEQQAKIIGNWIFGCDICQNVCPFNRKAKPTMLNEFRELILGPTIDVNEILHWSEEEYLSRTKGSAAERASIEQWKRNAKILTKNTS